jgi:hypothetical protein
VVDLDGADAAMAEQFAAENATTSPGKQVEFTQSGHVLFSSASPSFPARGVSSGSTSSST